MPESLRLLVTPHVKRLRFTAIRCYQNMPHQPKPSVADAAAVDVPILQSCTDPWRRVAMVVGTSLKEFDAKIFHGSYVYKPVCIVAMEDSGTLKVKCDSNGHEVFGGLTRRGKT